jgi:hypothetical protein
LEELQNLRLQNNAVLELKVPFGNRPQSLLIQIQVSRVAFG